MEIDKIAINTTLFKDSSLLYKDVFGFYIKVTVNNMDFRNLGIKTYD